MLTTRKNQLIAIAVGVLVTFWASSIKGSYQVYFLDLASMCGLGRGSFSLTSALFGLSIGVLSPVVGWICDKIGPAVTILSGAIVASVVYFIMIFEFNFTIFLILFGFFAAYALTAMTFVPLALLIDKMFDNKNKGMAYAAITNGTAIGFMVLSPMWVWLSIILTWQQVSIIIFGVFTFVILPACIWLCQIFPVSTFTNSATPNSDTLNKQPVRKHLTEPTFFLLALSFAGCGASMAYIDVHMVPLLQERFVDNDGQVTIVATSLSVLGAAELIGAFLVGYLLRSSPPALILALLYAVRGTSLLILLAAEDIFVCVIFAVLFGLTYMGTIIITSMLCLKAYGESIKGKMFGFLFTIHQVFVFATVWLGGVSYDYTQSYTLITLLVTSLCFVSAISGVVFHNSKAFNTKAHTHKEAIS